MNTEQIKARAKQETDHWLNPLPTPVFSNAGVTAYGHDCHQIGVESGIKIGLEESVKYPEDVLATAIRIANELYPDLACQEMDSRLRNDNSRTSFNLGYLHSSKNYAAILAAKDKAIREALLMNAELEKKLEEQKQKFIALCMEIQKSAEEDECI